jgi:hypothetical protein
VNFLDWPTNLPLAAADDWMKFVIPFVFLIIYVLNHLLGGAKPKPGQPRSGKPIRKPQMAERMERAPRAPAAETSPQQAKLNAEIEEFLKRADARRGESQRGKQPKPPQSQPAAPPKPPRESKRDRRQRKFGEVADSVEKHLGDRGFEKRAEHLADDVTRSEEQMEEHLQKAFGHRVGTLAEPGGEAAAPVTDVKTAPEPVLQGTANEFAALLANPRTLKQFVVLSEILARPETRW